MKFFKNIFGDSIQTKGVLDGVDLEGALAT